MQITQQIHQLTIPFNVPSPNGTIPRSVNLFFVNGSGVTLIDSGVKGAETAIFTVLQAIYRQPAEVKQLLLTHAHPDHIGAALALREACGCRIAAHGAERSWIEDVALQERERPVPGFQLLVGGSVAVDVELKEGDSIELDDGLSLDVLHTPGHSAGSVSLWLARGRGLFSGDAVPLPGDMPIFSDYRASVASLERLRACKAELLLSAWDVPRHGDEVRRCIDDAIAWLVFIRETVLAVAEQSPDCEPMELCRWVVQRLGLPPFAANPLVARSFMACLKDEEI